MSRAWWESPFEEQAPKGRQARFARRFRHGPLVLFLAVLLMIPAAIGALSLIKDPSDPRKEHLNTWAHPATSDAVLLQCGDTFTFDIASEQYGVIPDSYKGKTVPRHEHIVPAYGYMTDYVEKSKPVYAPDDKDLPNSPEVMRWMYEGKKIIWYPNANNEETLGYMRDFTSKHEDFIALPWRVEYGGVNDNNQVRSLPMKRNIGLSAWGVSKSCGLWDERIGEEFDQFVEKHQNMDRYPLRNAELTSEGDLPQILND